MLAPGRLSVASFVMGALWRRNMSAIFCIHQGVRASALEGVREHGLHDHESISANSCYRAGQLVFS